MIRSSLPVATAMSSLATLVIMACTTSVLYRSAINDYTRITDNQSGCNEASHTETLRHNVKPHMKRGRLLVPTNHERTSYDCQKRR